MIQREIAPGAAILALHIIALKNILPGEGYPFIRSMYVAVQPDYGRHRVGVRDGVQLMAVGRAHQFAFVQVNHNKSPLH